MEAIMSDFNMGSIVNAMLVKQLGISADPVQATFNQLLEAQKQDKVSLFSKHVESFNGGKGCTRCLAANDNDPNAQMCKIGQQAWDRDERFFKPAK